MSLRLDVHGARRGAHGALARPLRQQLHPHARLGRGLAEQLPRALRGDDRDACVSVSVSV